MKTYVLIVSKYFPKPHPKAGELTHFSKQIKDRIKKHTIRFNYDLWADRIHEVKEGKAIISVREWTGKPYNSKQIEINQVIKEDNPGIEEIFMSYSPGRSIEVSIEDKYMYLNEKANLYRNDGLSYQDFFSWFFQKEYSFHGGIIHFTNFRYKDLT